MEILQNAFSNLAFEWFKAFPSIMISFRYMFSCFRGFMWGMFWLLTPSVQGRGGGGMLMDQSARQSRPPSDVAGSRGTANHRQMELVHVEQQTTAR